ncbi:hypothetical protein K458DRAFT_88851 [Lentithecium fluviatile CBS 122367]|uniref:Uncharacterized protein n=1 Tax=Lentithecium fluviatile CBS 122367 TaxID=1168545 RepID=A0A6G1IRI3_9PLEO|nr:hypothetical protein K458DRAFT_88851 [Lentithecium fluviatile CBS 122367]
MCVGKEPSYDGLASSPHHDSNETSSGQTSHSAVAVSRPPYCNLLTPLSSDGAVVAAIPLFIALRDRFR